jgi:hypothetical protein
VNEQERELKGLERYQRALPCSVHGLIVALDNRVSRAFRFRHDVRAEAKYECDYTAT